MRASPLLILLALAAITLLPSPGLAQAPDPKASDTLTPQIEAIRVRADLPALGGAIVTRDGLEGAWVSGVRARGHDEKATVDDLWHLGSCSKAMTATLIALLVERGDLDWESTLAEGLPAFKDTMDARLSGVTLTELLAHRGGLPAGPPAKLWSELFVSSEAPTEQRRKLAQGVLSLPPVGTPGQSYLYSNVGIALAGLIAESQQQASYESLMQRLLFEPLGMKSAGFGAPGAGSEAGAGIDAPRGHDGAGKPIDPKGPGADNPPAIAPAGRVHASLADWAKFIQLHLRGAKADVKVGDTTLHRETFEHLHTAFNGPGDPYALGWVVGKRPWAGGDGTVLMHNGSNTMWYCVNWLAPDSGFAVLAVTNMVGSTGQSATDEVCALLLKRHGGG